MTKKGSEGSSSADIQPFSTIWQQFLAISSWIFEKVVPGDLPVFTGTIDAKTKVSDSNQPQNHKKDNGEGREEMVGGKGTPRAHNVCIAYFEDSF